MSGDDLYEGGIHEQVEEEDAAGRPPDELAVDDHRVNTALRDLKDDFSRARSELAREELDPRASLSVPRCPNVETAALSKSTSCGGGPAVAGRVERSRFLCRPVGFWDLYASVPAAVGFSACRA
jgi:hypothetical protein